ncbi:TPA: hypothetical protein DCL28_01805 [Candidatus Komeilibacteria bacterium]|nr:MAG: hypothetical protein A2260_00935 [Candidatus Komeilibacteria bacterium RIFOXYA2_FULL_45_9]HAH04276.1 hypothetical protein [Candidatus Komeilibacteria bacterium]
MVNLIREPEIKVSEKIVEVNKVIRQPDCGNNFNDYQFLVNKGQFLTLVKEKNTYASNGAFINGFNVNINRSGDGKIACGFLYIKTRINGKGLDENYDSVYINPNGFGGQILRTKSLSIENKEENKTQVLLPLNSISYLPTLPYNPNAQDYEISNWVNLLNTGDKVNFQIGLSALDSRGYIDEITLAYKCWDSSTGQETQDCQLSLDK